MTHDLIVSTADDRGVPTCCSCSCGWRWQRPDGDDHADTLPDAARAHNAEVLTATFGRPERDEVDGWH
jgi:hypothetical protein